MRRNTLNLAILTISLVALSRMAFADGASVARMVFFNARPGSKAPLEEAIKKQMALGREEKDQ